MTRRDIATVASLACIAVGAFVIVAGVIRQDSTDLAVGAGLIGGPQAVGAGRNRK